METKLLLIRHGQTPWNKLGKFQGCSDIELSDEGIKQAEHLSEYLNGNFDCVYASPLKRARKTAEIIAAKSETKPIIVNDLREINFGLWEGLTIDEIENSYEEQFEVWKKNPGDAVLYEGEMHLKNACDRIKKALIDIVSKNKYKKILVVAHGGILKAAILAIFNLDPGMYHNMFLTNTSVTELVFSDDHAPVLYTLNNTAHLSK